jgi:excisionase family DNA binding protein
MPDLSKIAPGPNDLTMVQAAEIARVHRNTVRRWVFEEGLPAYRSGRAGRIMIRPDDLARFLEVHQQL